MSDRPKSKRKNTDFWRACRFLWPYRFRMLVSGLCAIFVGIALTGGLGTLLPIMSLFTNGDTLHGFIFRSVDNTRLGVKLNSQNPGVVQILQFSNNLTKGSPARDAGIPLNATIDDAPPLPNDREIIYPAKNPQQANAYHAALIMRRIALHLGSDIVLTVNGKPVTVHLVALHPLIITGLHYVDRLPIGPVQSVAVIFGVLTVISLAGQIVRFFQEHLANESAVMSVNDIRRQLYDRVMRMPLRYFGTHGASDVTSRLVSDCDTLQEGFKIVLGQSIQEPIKAAMAMGFALYLSWKLTLIIVVFAPIMAIVVRKFGKKMRRASRAALQSSSVMLGQIEATLNGIRVVKASTAEPYERRRYMHIIEKLTGEHIRMSKIDAGSAPVLETVIMLMVGAVLLIATHMIFVSGTLETSKFILILAALGAIAESLRKASKVSIALQRGNAAATRIFATLALPSEHDRKVRRATPELPHPIRLAPFTRAIEFQNVTFSYPSSNSTALNSVSLTVPRGQSVAVVGRNGSGKTTLLALLERFYDPDSGRILLDGQDIRAASLSSLRRQIALVTQDSFIFPGTIAQNIAYGNSLARPDAKNTAERRQLMEDIESAARRAFAHEFIMEKTGGYNSILGEMGGQLSGGQRQRMCIARAILRNAPILILDEATSQVDAESEHLIQQAIEQLMHQRTTFVIAHRFSTIISADTIVVMERGNIVGQGNHDQLLQSCQTYQQLYERQLFVGAQ